MEIQIWQVLRALQLHGSMHKTHILSPRQRHHFTYICVVTVFKIGICCFKVTIMEKCFYLPRFLKNTPYFWSKASYPNTTRPCPAQDLVAARRLSWGRVEEVVSRVHTGCTGGFPVLHRNHCPKSFSLLFAKKVSEHVVSVPLTTTTCPSPAQSLTSLCAAASSLRVLASLCHSCPQVSNTAGSVGAELEAGSSILRRNPEVSAS